MTAQEALNSIKSVAPMIRVFGCLDFGNFYAFSFAPMDANQDKIQEVGVMFTGVDKKTGKIFDYDITSNVDAYLSAKEVNVETIYDKKIG